jgi:spermidine/putrescine transport system ATP-binding protein
MTASLSIQNVTRNFGDITALDDVSLEVTAGEYIVLLGPSGCGKTTLLSILGGFLSPTRGRVLVGERDMSQVPPAKRPTTTMFQDYALFPHMTARDNVSFGLRMRGMGRSERGNRADTLLDTVGLKDSSRRKPHELSGGQRQRVALARSLAVDPDVLLLDEPLGALDLKLRRQMQDELKTIQKRVGTTFVHVTHDQEEAMAIGDRIVVMNQGRIEDFGAPADVYMRPRSRFSADFMGEVNFIAARIAAADSQTLTVQTAFGPFSLTREAFGAREPKLAQEITLCIRPEQFRPAQRDTPRTSLGRARVLDAAFFGTHFRCHVIPEMAPDTVIVAHMPQSSHPAKDDDIELTLDTAQIVAVPAQSAGE